MHAITRCSIAVAIAVLAAPIAAVGQAVEAPTQVATPISGFAFEPTVAVAVGGQVTWTNEDPVDHTVTARDGAFDSGSLSAGATFSRTFDTVGTFEYACAIHPSMMGTITVLDRSGQATEPTGPRVDLVPATILHRTTVLDTDPLGLGGPALTLLVPEGWSVQGGPVWRHDVANLATLEARVVSPDLTLGVEYFPLFPRIWQDGGIPFFRRGSNYLGHEVRPPIRDAVRYVEELVLPTHRGAVSARVIDHRPLPGVAAAVAAASLPGTEVVAEHVLTEHFVGGERMLEEFTVVLTITPNPWLPGALLWSPWRVTSVRAPEAAFDAAYPVLHAIASSPVVDLRWYAGYEAVLDLAQRNGLEAIRAAGAASRIIAQTNAEISDIIVRGYQERQVVEDRVFEGISQTIRGVEVYTDPWDGAALELPNGYDYVYTSDQGTVILTNEPAFDPIQVFPLETWETVEPDR